MLSDEKHDFMLPWLNHRIELRHENMQMSHGQIHPYLFWDKGIVCVSFHGVGKQFSHLGLLSSDLTALTWPENIFAICCSFLFQRELNKCPNRDTSEEPQDTLMRNIKWVYTMYS